MDRACTNSDDNAPLPEKVMGFLYMPTRIVAWYTTATMDAAVAIQAVVAWLQVHVPYTFFIPLLGAFFGGEETILVISMLTATGALSFPEVVLFSFLGTMLSDACWFQFGRYAMERLERRPNIKNKFVMVADFIRTVARGRTFVALLITKFLYGTRIIMIFYLGKIQLSFRQFMLYNSVVTAIWSVAVCSLGYFAGKGVIGLLETYHNFAYSVSIVAAFIFVIYVLRIWLNRMLVEKARQSQ
jgi:membrane protein DedA with SNARE-associated domain